MGLNMEKDKKTKKLLIECAKREFFEKGFMMASLRNICKSAGVTTGALYFFFEDKEDLFDSIVGGPLQELELVIERHFNQELQGLNENTGSLDDDYKTACDTLNTLYKFKEEFELLLNRAQGSQYENVVDRIVEYFYNHYLEIYWRMKGYDSPDQLKYEDKFIVHWMAHDQIDIFVHILSHCKDEEDARKQLRNMFNYMVGGWIATIEKSVV